VSIKKRIFDILINNTLDVMGDYITITRRLKKVISRFFKINTIILGLICGLVVLSTSGCKIEPAEINLSSSNIVIPNTSGSDRISFTCNGKWTVTATKAWLTIEPSFGKGDGEIVIKYDDNSLVEERSGEIILSSGALSKTVTIIQSKSSLDFDKYSLSFPRDSSTLRFYILSNTTWQVTVPPEINWISVSPASGNLNMHIDVTVDPNPGFLREADIVVKYAQIEKKLKIIQQRGINGPPEQTVLKSPTNNSSDENRFFVGLRRLITIMMK